MSRNLDVLSKCSVEAIKNTTLCKLHKVYKEFRTMGSNAPVWTASFTLVRPVTGPGVPWGFSSDVITSPVP